MTGHYLKYRFVVFAFGTLCFTVILFWGGCKEKYALPETLIDKNYLVVEGFINSGGDTTEIRLSRTVRPGDTSYISPEQNAAVAIVGENGDMYPLNETKPGVYRGGPHTLNEPTKYSLTIQTSNGRQYASDFVEVKKTPPIDSINWTREQNGVTVYANTHAPQNNLRYYAWQFDETWEFYSYAWSSYDFREEDSTMFFRSNPEKIFRCWQSDRSTNILIGSSAKLSEDIIYMAPLTFIPDDSWKLSVKYSIRVKQRVLSKGAFEYLEKMKKNSEQLGSIFDPQPSTSSGNIRCTTDPAEVVIGYVYISSVVEKRIFIDRSELPGWKYRMFCNVDTVPNIKDSLAFFFGAIRWEPISAVSAPGGGISDYTASSPVCMDCTLRGTNVKPDFWP